jgi:DNA repair exonuclease SbcCD nuclease subunit
MKVLIISDLHFTDSPDEDYRWGVFDWTKTKIKENKCSHLFILGDIFDKKDRHPATIVNRLAGILMEIATTVPITILQGNHDYLKPEHPFLSFLDHLPNIRWLDTPTVIDFPSLKTLWLPHSRNPVEEWTPIFERELPVNMVFMHQSVIGCKVSNYYELNNGLDLKWLEDQVQCTIISGDIHVPQTIRSLTYVGTQHPVSFGDDYDCRALLLTTTTNKNVKVKTWELESLSVPGIKRHSIAISSLDDLKELHAMGKLRPSDHVKIKILLTSDQLSKWTTLKEIITNWCNYTKLKLFDIKLEKIMLGETPSKSTESKTFVPVHPTETFKRFLLQESVDETLAALGQEILNEVLNEQ